MFTILGIFICKNKEYIHQVLDHSLIYCGYLEIGWDLINIERYRNVIYNNYPSKFNRLKLDQLR